MCRFTDAPFVDHSPVLCLLKTFIFKTCASLSDVEVVDQYGNKTDCLNADIVKTLSVSANGLDKSALAIEWQVLYTQPQTQTNEQFLIGMPSILPFSAGSGTGQTGQIQIPYCVYTILCCF